MESRDQELDHGSWESSVLMPLREKPGMFQKFVVTSAAQVVPLGDGSGQLEQVEKPD